MAFYDIDTDVPSHLVYHNLLIKAATSLSKFKEWGPRSHLSMRGKEFVAMF